MKHPRPPHHHNWELFKMPDEQIASFAREFFAVEELQPQRVARRFCCYIEKRQTQQRIERVEAERAGVQ